MRRLLKSCRGRLQKIHTNIHLKSMRALISFFKEHKEQAHSIQMRVVTKNFKVQKPVTVMRYNNGQEILQASLVQYSLKSHSFFRGTFSAHCLLDVLCGLLLIRLHSFWCRFCLFLCLIHWDRLFSRLLLHKFGWKFLSEV